MILRLILALLICTSSLYAEKRVLVGTPVCQKPAILQEFLASLLRQEREGYTFDYYFVDDNRIEESSELLRAFAPPAGEKIFIKSVSPASVAFVCDDERHHWNEELIWRVAGFKDDMIEHARERGYDYLFLIDSDLILHPKTVAQLIAVDKEIVSNIFWTAWATGERELPQVWLFDHYLQYRVEIGEQLPVEEAARRRELFLATMRSPGTYEVGGLCACTLLSQSALNRGVSFARINNITLWGEDRHFCIRAQALGLSLHVDTHYPAFHIYRESDLAGVSAFKESCCAL